MASAIGATAVLGRGRHLTKPNSFWYNPYLIFVALGFLEFYIFSQKSSAVIGVSKVGRPNSPSPSALRHFPVSALSRRTASASDRPDSDSIRPEEG
jgi:hypothetical protein